MVINPYKELGVSPSMSKDEIKKVYRSLARRYHPDTATGDEGKFKRICEAWKIIDSRTGNSKIIRGTGSSFSPVSHVSLFKFRRV